VIDERKVRDYLLNPLHARGGHKARMFAAALGHQRADFQDLIVQIRSGILVCQAERMGRFHTASAFGSTFRSLAAIARRWSAPFGSTGWAKMSPGSPRPIRSDDRRRRRAAYGPRFELLQVVYVRGPHPALGLAKGECGTIVEVLDRPDAAYLVEFIHEDGSTKIEAAFNAGELSATPPPP
jgi:Domain of unknown function (DUF4926)